LKAKELLEEIFRTKTVYDAAGKQYSLHGNVGENEGIFLRALVEKYKPTSTIEIGCAFGISSLFISSALEKMSGNKHHTIIDGFQSTTFHNIGVTNLKKADVDFYQLIEGLSEVELPKLLAEGKKYDFCFIDGNHTFDHTLLDFFYLNRMLKVGGIMVFDDIGFPAVTKALRYVLNYPSYQYVGHVPVNYTQKRKFFEAAIKKPLGFITNLFPHKLRYELFSASINKTDQQLHLNTSMIALQKVSEDDRQWHWYENF
jgi:predicted O-methyltransferase YrrM